MKQRSNFIKVLNCTLLILTFALRSYTDAVYESRGITSGVINNLKYVTLSLGIALCFIQIFAIKKYHAERKFLIYEKELVKILRVVIIFLIISLIYVLFEGKTTRKTFEELIKMILPILYSFCILNTLNFKDIYKCMIAVLFFSIAGYMLEIGLDVFTIANMKLISFNSSYSPFESHYAAASSIAMCAFFLYYRKKSIYKYISLLFAILTFKRLSVIFAIVLFVLPLLIDVNMILRKKWIYLTKFIFILAVYVYKYLLVNPDLFEKIFHVNTIKFTMGRSAYLETLLYANFKSYGFGSTTAFIGKSIEMDLIKIAIELSIIGLVVFVNNYWDIVRNHLYCVIYMFFVFLNLLTSHSLTNVFGWTLTYLIIGTILYKQNVDSSYFLYETKNNTKRFNGG